MYDELMEIVKTRRSCRAFEARPVADELVAEVIEAGIWAASGHGQQSPVVIRVTDSALKARLIAENAAVMGASGMDPFYGAPEILLVLANRAHVTAVYDGTLVLGNMMLAAHALGLASCWIHRAKEEAAKRDGVVAEILAKAGIAGDYEGVGHLALGYRAGELPAPPARKDGRVFTV